MDGTLAREKLLERHGLLIVEPARKFRTPEISCVYSALRCASAQTAQEVASPNLESSNQLFETLEEWNVTLSVRLQRSGGEGRNCGKD
jgi:hypothetical protein